MAFKMQIGMPGKRYGLQQRQLPKPKIVFQNDDDCDGDEEESPAQVKERINRNLQQRAEQRPIAESAAKALVDDPDIFDFDKYFEQKTNDHDKMMTSIREKNKGARFMNAMQKAAETRRLENDIWYTAKLKREAAESAEAAQEDLPQEVFVTNAWRQRLEEIHKHKVTQDAKEAKEASMPQGDFNKKLLDFRSRLLGPKELTLTDMVEVEEKKVEKEEDYYASLNTGIRQEALKEKQGRLAAKASAKAVAEAAAAEAAALEAADEDVVDDDAEVLPEGTDKPVDEIVAKLGPSAALLAAKAQVEETPEERLTRKRLRWNRQTDANMEALARKRFLERQQLRADALKRA